MRRARLPGSFADIRRQPEGEGPASRGRAADRPTLPQAVDGIMRDRATRRYALDTGGRQRCSPELLVGDGENGTWGRHDDGIHHLRGKAGCETRFVSHSEDDQYRVL